MHRTLIVARMKPDSAPGIADVFADSDRGELPHLIGVRGRSLFQFGDVYLHLIESDRPAGPEVARHTGHPEFRALRESMPADGTSRLLLAAYFALDDFEVGLHARQFALHLAQLLRFGR